MFTSKTSSRVLFTIFSIFLFQKGIYSESIRCDGSIIDPGDTQSRVLEKCGEPTDRTDYTVYTITHSRYGVNSYNEEFLLDRYITTYTGSGSTFHDLTSHVHENFTGRRFSPGSHFSGKKHKHQYTHSFWRCNQRTEKKSVWVYNLGPTQFIRSVTIQNGIVLEISTGEYGYE